MNRSFICVAITALLPTFSDAGEVHEWGTFTTVSGSDGRILSGLHVEEEQLPQFVYSHGGMLYKLENRRSGNQQFVLNGKPFNGLFKGLPLNSVSNVTVKMETPVLYFYGDKREKYTVKVNFNGGTISQWYPQRKVGDVLPPMEVNRELAKKNPLDFSKPFNGFIEWDVDVIPRAEADEALTFKPNQSLSWEYPRVPEANMLKVGDEYENYLFYRGVGHFSQPVEFRVDDEDTVNIKNVSGERIPFAFAFENTGGKVRYKTFEKGVSASTTERVTLSDWKTCESKNWRVEVFQEVRNGLLEQGLNLAEANGMVKTWWKSYFEHQGLRVFWVVPAGELKKVLPIQITPAPEKLVRVIVGRSDILRPSFEKKLIKIIAEGHSASLSYDRFYLPYQERVKRLVSLPMYLTFSKEVLKNKTLDVREQSEGSKVKGRIRFNHDKAYYNDKEIGKWQVLSDDVLEINGKQYQLDRWKHELVGPSLDGGKGLQVIILPVVLQ